MFVTGYTGPKPVKRWSLRAAYVGATLATALAALTTQPARAHFDVRPSLVEENAVVALLVELPELRTGSEPERLELEGTGVTVLSSSRQGGLGGETRWSVRIRVEAEPGAVPLVLRAVYPDGRSIELDHALTVVPADDEDEFPWFAAIVGVTAVAGIAGAGLFLTRRKA